jgi:hypothetical protein
MTEANTKNKPYIFRIFIQNKERELKYMKTGLHDIITEYIGAIDF